MRVYEEIGDSWTFLFRVTLFPVDRDKNGSRIHVLSEAEGIPLVVGVSQRTPTTAPCCARCSTPFPRSGPAADRDDADRSSARDKGFNSAAHRCWLRERRDRAADRPPRHQPQRPSRAAPMERSNAPSPSSPVTASLRPATNDMPMQRRVRFGDDTVAADPGDPAQPMLLGLGLAHHEVCGVPSEICEADR